MLILIKRIQTYRASGGSSGEIIKISFINDWLGELTIQKEGVILKALTIVVRAFKVLQTSDLTLMDLIK